MYHENHPDDSYEMANLVLAFEPPRAISWKPGYVSPETGKLEFGGWIWGYDLTSSVRTRPRSHFPMTGRR
jgi:hypothetical protein